MNPRGEGTTEHNGIAHDLAASSQMVQIEHFVRPYIGRCDTFGHTPPSADGLPHSAGELMGDSDAQDQTVMGPRLFSSLGLPHRMC